MSQQKQATGSLCLKIPQKFLLLSLRAALIDLETFGDSFLPLENSFWFFQVILHCKYPESERIFKGQKQNTKGFFFWKLRNLRKIGTILQLDALYYTFMNFSYCSWTVRRMTSFACFLLPIFVVIATWHPYATTTREILSVSRQNIVTHYYKCQLGIKWDLCFNDSCLLALEKLEMRRKKTTSGFLPRGQTAALLKCWNRKNTFGGHEKCVDTLAPAPFLTLIKPSWREQTRFYG